MSNAKNVVNVSDKNATEKSDSKSEFVPPRKSFTVEFWVGLFTLAGVVCFSYLAINIAGMRFSNVGFYAVKASFTNIAGLKVGAPVEIAGVQVGEVVNVSLADTEAVIEMQVRDEVKLRDDDIAQIRTKGIIGDKYVKISPGGSEEVIGNGGEVSETESAVEFEDVIGKIVHSLSSDKDED